jgi:hypothetical protein
MPEIVDDVLAALAGELNDSVAAQACAMAAVVQFGRVFMDRPTLPENPDPTVHFGNGDPNEPGTMAYARWRRSVLLDRTRPRGEVNRQLGRQWVVSFFSSWEEDFRPRLARARGVPMETIVAPLLGDLRRLRNDIVHHRGRATRNNTGRCEVLTHWFRPDDEIVITAEKFEEFVTRFPWDSLRGSALPQDRLEQ